jgi:DNA uptake protein ComE-like DNA-binding protein
MRTTTLPCVQHRLVLALSAALLATVTLPAAAVATATAASAPAPAHPTSAAAKKPPPAAAKALVDINGATRSQLKTLPGIGDAEADKIIAGRPYLSKAELVTKHVMPTGPYLSIKYKIVALQKGAPKAKS